MGLEAGGGFAELKQELDFWRGKTEKADFIERDPVQFPRRYKLRQDAEIAAFLAAAVAWGRRDIILRSCENMFSIMGKSPFDFVMQKSYGGLRDRGNIHRTFFAKDLEYFCRGLRRCYEKYSGSLENVFTQAGGVWQGISLLRREMAAANKGLPSKHMADPGEGETGSACKRMNLALRWLARPGPVDMALWKNIKSADLYIPLDLHAARAARDLGLLSRKSNDKKAAVFLTEKLRGFCPQDPVKYDFALFGRSVSAALGGPPANSPPGR